MSVIIPEKIIVETLERIIKLYYNDLVAKEAIGSVTDATAETSGFTISVTQQGSVGLPEITDVTTVGDTGGDLASKYWFLNTPSKQFVVWYSVDGVGTDPSIADRDSIKVSVVTNDTAIAVAVATAEAINFKRNFTVPVPITSTMTVTNVETNAEQRSKLWQIFGGVTFDDMDYFFQMASILKDKYNEEKRKLKIGLGFDENRKPFPVISVLLPSEENQPKQTGVTGGVVNYFDGTAAKLNTHAFSDVYNLMVTSDNQNEVVIVYHFLKTIILTGLVQFDRQGLNNLWVTGRDITMDFEMSPMTVYHRTVAMSFFYCNQVPDIAEFTDITGVTFTGTNINS